MTRRRFRKPAGHIRVVCPHCGRNVTVQHPAAFQRAVPCPNCRIPIDTDYILAEKQAAEEAESASETAAGASEADADEPSATAGDTTD